MSDLAKYHETLRELVLAEMHKHGYSRPQFAEMLGFTDAALGKWVNKTLKGELSSGAIAALAEYLKCDRAALQEYLHTGKWPDVRKALTLEDRLAALESLVNKLARRPSQFAGPPSLYSAGPSRERLQEMTVLGMEMQNALTAMNVDWRCLSTIQAMHAFTELPQSQGGLNAEPDILISRFQEILWGQSLPNGDELPEVRMIMYCYTGDHERWTWDYVKALVKRRYQQPAGPSSRVAATK